MLLSIGINTVQKILKVYGGLIIYDYLQQIYFIENLFEFYIAIYDNAEKLETNWMYKF